MLEALFWGAVGGFALIVGALAAMVRPVPSRITSLVMGFGAGVLISVLSHELTIESYERGGADVLSISMGLGALTFFGANILIARMGGGDRKRSQGQQAEGSGTAIVLGTVLDGIPESAVIGISLLGGDGVSTAVVAAIFISNIPESLSATTGLLASGRGRWGVLGMWGIVLVVSAVSSALGYGLLGNASQGLVGSIEGFAAGAILMMLADTMMPEAVQHGGNRTGLVTVAGFVLAFLLSQQ
ncbi:MAG: putative integral rane protein [Thermoleophilia bacterium]|nr:putative integral rane protein [Thermoleophilia bacterium]